VHVEVTSVDEAALVEVGPSLAAKVAGLRQAAASVVAVRLDGRIAAFFAVRDVVRPGAAEAVSRLRALGLGVRMWSGDHAVAARAVGSELGMTVDEVRAGLSPEGKADALAALSGVGPVAMVGDGVNDAPALALSAVGIAMGGGAASARQTAGITLVHPDPRLIAEAVALSRRTMRIVRQNLGWAFGYNLVMVPLAATGQLERFGGPMLASAAMAGSSITVVLNSLRLRRTRLEASRPMPER
jgi:Cu+-exporting ATPase